MEKTEKLKKENIIFKGKVLRFHNDEVKLPNGEIATRETVNHPGGVGILAIKDGFVYLVKQYRYVFGKEILEIPAGKLEKRENTLSAAKREISEEIGTDVKKIKYLGEFYPSVGYTDEVIYLYVTKDFELKDQHLDDDEFVDVVKMPILAFKKKIAKNEIKDGKTIAAWHLYKASL